MAGKYALIIACSEYQDERLHRLPKTEADAAGMQRVLVDQQLCGSPQENVNVLLNQDGRSVRIAIERFFKQRNVNDRVLFYYAGHGIVDDKRRLAFALSETDPDFLGTAIDARWLREEMEDCRAKQQILILDCCNSGAFDHKRDGASSAGIKEAFEAKGRYVLTASDRLQFSFEKLERAEQIKNGLFTHFLLEGLESFAAAEAGGEVITVDSLFEYARSQVSAATAHKQTPLLFVSNKQARLELARRVKPRIPVELQQKLASDDHRERLLAVHELKALAHEKVLTDAVRTGLQAALTQERDYVVRDAIMLCLRDLDGISVVSAPAVSENTEGMQKEASAAEYEPLAVFQDRLKSGEKGSEMVVIPAGEFQMGSPSSEPERDESEGPQHRVRIEKPFAIGKYAVTFEEYDAFVEATQRDKPGDEDWGRGRRPVINVSWEDATAYAKWLSEQTEKHYRLPSEAEWEYAARAGTTTPFHTGEQITTEQANFDGNYTYNSILKFLRETSEKDGGC